MAVRGIGSLERSALVCLAAGTLLRLLWMLVHPHQPFVDELDYHQLARGLAQGQPYGAPLWPPGWPLTLSVLYRLCGARPDVALAFNTAVSLGTLVGICALASRLYGPRAGAVSLALAALMPSYILANALLMYEVWLQFLLVVGAWAALRARWAPRQVLLVGLCAGLAALMRPFWLFLLPLALWLLARCRYGGPPPAALLGSQVVALVCVAPWLLELSSSAGEFVPLARNGGVNLWIGNNPAATGYYLYPPGQLLDPRNDALARAEALAWVRAHPGRALALLPHKLWYMLRGETWGEWVFAQTRYAVAPQAVAAARHLSNLYYWAVALLALAGSAHALRCGRRWALGLWVMFLCNLAGYLPFFGLERFRWPVQFVLVIYAADALSRRWPIRRWWPMQRPAVPHAHRQCDGA